MKREEVWVLFVESALRGGSETPLTEASRCLAEYDLLFPAAEKKPALPPHCKVGVRPISEAQFAKWVTAYPAIDVDQELRKMGAWLDANPTKKPRNINRFCVNWFNRLVDKEGTKAPPRLGRIDPGRATESELAYCTAGDLAGIGEPTYQQAATIAAFGVKPSDITTETVDGCVTWAGYIDLVRGDK